MLFVSRRSFLLQCCINRGLEVKNKKLYYDITLKKGKEKAGVLNVRPTLIFKL